MESPFDRPLITNNYLTYRQFDQLRIFSGDPCDQRLMLVCLYHSAIY